MRPLTHRVMERVARDEYDGGMPLAAARKDSTLALAMAQRSGVPLFATQAAQTVCTWRSRPGSRARITPAIARGSGRTGRATTSRSGDRMRRAADGVYALRYAHRTASVKNEHFYEHFSDCMGPWPIDYFTWDWIDDGGSS